MPNKVLEGKTALITGVGRINGIGAAVVQHFAEAGARLFVSYFRAYDMQQAWSRPERDGPNSMFDHLGAQGIQVQHLEADLGDIETPARLFNAAIEHFGAIDILVNNAAHSRNATIHDLTASLIDQHFNVNARGMMLMCAEYVHRWSDHPSQRNGRIINLTSGQGIGSMPGELPYAASKGAVDAFTISLSHEVMPLGITVNAVDPGITDTGWLSTEQHTQLLQKAPYGRIGTPDDAARLILFLASDESDWITGQIIRSRGGL